VAGWTRNEPVEGVPVDIYVPENYSGRNILMLPGWNFPKTGWIDKTELLRYADAEGYALLLPEMGKSLYEGDYHPETRMRWGPIPGGRFIREYLLPAVRKRHSLFLPDQKSYLIGLSTGGRGVALIALENPGAFAAGAALSGDFSQENMPSDRLMTAVYGPYRQFKKRWIGQDNPMARAGEWKMPLYLAHGESDRVVPPAQSRLFYERLRQIHADTIDIVYRSAKGEAHDYRFWNSELEPVFAFFRRH
jgi:S-formylglutathione hydrolase FrmB